MSEAGDPNNIGSGEYYVHSTGTLSGTVNVIGALAITGGTFTPSALNVNGDGEHIADAPEPPFSSVALGGDIVFTNGATVSFGDWSIGSDPSDESNVVIDAANVTVASVAHGGGSCNVMVRQANFIVTNDVTSADVGVFQFTLENGFVDIGGDATIYIAGSYGFLRANSLSFGDSSSFYVGPFEADDPLWDSKLTLDVDTPVVMPEEIYFIGPSVILGFEPDYRGPYLEFEQDVDITNSVIWSDFSGYSESMVSTGGNYIVLTAEGTITGDATLYPDIEGNLAIYDDEFEEIVGNMVLEKSGNEVRFRYVPLAPPVPPSILRTAFKLVMVSGVTTYIGTNPTSLSAVSNSATYPMNGSAPYCSAATLFGHTYLVDGTNIRKLDLDTEAFVAFSASAGSLPSGCTIAVGWRGRLILSGSDTDPQNIFASRVGDPSDFDYGQEDPAAAWAGNAAPSGRVGAPIIALVPLSDDILLVFGEQSIYAVRGDPADGGSIDMVSDQAGIVSPNAWTRDAVGNVYFVGPGGFYRAAPDGSNPVEISRDVYRQFFQAIDRRYNYINLMYDQQRYGIWIMVSPTTEGTPGRSLFYDIRGEGYWPMEWTNYTAAGPTATVYWDGIGSDLVYPVLGGYDGALYALSFTNRRDQGTDIPSYVQFQPFCLSQIDDAILHKIDITGGEVRTGDTADVWNMNLTISGGKSAYDVTEGTPAISHAFNWPDAGRQLSRVTRVRGGWFSVRLSNSAGGNYFSFEQGTAQIVPAGTQR